METIARTNALFRQHLFGREIKLERMPRDKHGKVEWRLTFGNRVAPPCRIFAFLKLPELGWSCQVQYGRGRLCTTPTQNIGQAHHYRSQCFLCHKPFMFSVGPQDKSSMDKRGRLLHAVCPVCTVFTSPRCNNTYAMCHILKRTRRCTPASLVTYTAKRASRCLVIQLEVFRQDLATASMRVAQQKKRYSKRRPRSTSGDPAGQELGQILVDLITTSIWSEATAVADLQGTVNTRQRIEGARVSFLPVAECMPIN